MSYKIHLTKDLEANFPNALDSESSFDVKPYTTNGPKNPLNYPAAENGLPPTGSTSAQTTLMLYGKGVPNYGEGIQENMIHMMEHFSSQFEPIYPLPGQVWNQTKNSAQSQLRVYNHKKFVVQIDTTDVVTSANPKYIALDATNTSAAERADFISRAVTNYRLTLTGPAGEQETYTVMSPASMNSTGNAIRFEVSPTPPAPRTGWRCGGWEYVMQNNMPLVSDLNVAGYKLKNLSTRESSDTWDDYEAVTKRYVDGTVTAAVESAISLHKLRLMDDVSISNLQNNHVLRYNTVTGMWTNQNLDASYLPLTGGSMAGDVIFTDFSGTQLPSVTVPTIRNLPMPANNSEVANKYYVDKTVYDYVVANGGSSTLNGLLDVTLVNSTAQDILRFNGNQWVNTPSTTFIADNRILTETGGGTIPSGVTIAINQGASLTTGNNPLIVNNAITGAPEISIDDADLFNDVVNASWVQNFIQQYDTYMQSFVNSAVSSAATEDNIVTAASFDEATSALTLERSGTYPDLVVTIPLAANGANTSISISDSYGRLGYYNTTGFATEEFVREEQYRTTHETTDLQTLMDDYNAAVGVFAYPRERMVFTSNGGTTIYLGDTSAGTLPGQMNPQNTDDLYYVTGFNNLQVYVNGLKQYASTHGYVTLYAAAGSETELWSTTQTGLTPGSSYTFTVNVNGQGDQLVTVTMPGGAPFTQPVTLADVVRTINAETDLRYFNNGAPNSNYAFSARLLEGTIVFTSALPGTGSSITVSQGTLFAGMTGNATTGLFTIDTGRVTPPSGYAPTTYHYNEVGRLGAESDVIQFVNAPEAGSVIEVIIDREMFQERIYN